MRSSGCMAALPSSWRRCRYRSPLRGGRSGTASSTSSTLEGIGRPTVAMPGRLGLRGATCAAVLLCSTRRRLPRLLMQFARRSSRSPHPILERAVWPGCSTRTSKSVKIPRSCDLTHGQARLMPRRSRYACPVETGAAPPQISIGACGSHRHPNGYPPGARRRSRCAPRSGAAAPRARRASPARRARAAGTIQLLHQGARACCHGPFVLDHERSHGGRPAGRRLCELPRSGGVGYSRLVRCRSQRASL